MMTLALIAPLRLGKIRPRSSGLTLIELMVALAIFSVLGILSMVRETRFAELAIALKNPTLFYCVGPVSIPMANQPRTWCLRA